MLFPVPLGSEENEQTNRDKDDLYEKIQDQKVVSSFLVVLSIHLVIFLVELFIAFELRPDFLLWRDVN